MQFGRNSSFSALRLIPLSQEGDILVPVYRGDEEGNDALNFLRLWSLWAIGLGLSADLTKKILEMYIKTVFHLEVYEPHANWIIFIEKYFTKHRLSGVENFKKWYKDTVQQAKVLVTWFSYDELALATRFFASANWLGQGSEGEVFKGRYDNLGNVAVKCFKYLPKASLNKVLREVGIHREMGRKAFPNIVHVLGYSTWPQCPLLVLEFMDNGNLRHHLEGVHGPHLFEHPKLRLSIAIDIANALVQLHYKGRWPIYHRDVKSTNILLNTEWRAKLSDLGLAVTIKSESDKTTPPSTYSQGYDDPVYMHSGVLDDKTDVWGFGVVLMELVTFLKVWDPNRKNERSLSELVVNRVKSGNPYSLIRFSGKASHPLWEMLERMMDVAVRCCEKDMGHRPRIDQVAEDLKVIARRLRNRAANKQSFGAEKPSPVDKGCIGWLWEGNPMQLM